MYCTMRHLQGRKCARSRDVCNVVSVLLGDYMAVGARAEASHTPQRLSATCRLIHAKCQSTDRCVSRVSCRKVYTPEKTSATKSVY